MGRARSWRWLLQPAALAALLLLVTAGAAIGRRAGGLTATAVGAGAGLLAAVLLLVAVDRIGAALAHPPDGSRTGPLPGEQRPADRRAADRHRADPRPAD